MFSFAVCLHIPELPSTLRTSLWLVQHPQPHTEKTWEREKREGRGREGENERGWGMGELEAERCETEEKRKKEERKEKSERKRGRMREWEKGKSPTECGCHLQSACVFAVCALSIRVYYVDSSVEHYWICLEFLMCSPGYCFPIQKEHWACWVDCMSALCSLCFALQCLLDF